jgi:glutamine amidotransferase
MTNLRERGLATAIRDYLDTGKPFLGICLGLQVLFGDSEETPGETGLGLIPGRVVRFPDGAPRIPHMGWNEIRVVRPTPLTEGLGDSFMAYFMHSYYGLPEDDSWVAGRTEHGITFASLLARDHVFAAQFHPEKSGAVGRQVLRNFVGLVEGH